MVGLGTIKGLLGRAPLAEKNLLQVRTGCRLHFGLMELAAGEALQYAGLGLMLTEPELILEFQPVEAAELVTSDIPAGWAEEVERRIAEVCQRRESLLSRSVDCKIRAIATLPLHHGLGSGTQLAAAVAVGLELYDRITQGRLQPNAAWQELSVANQDMDLRWLVQHSGRGLRSAVGLHGFLHGGLILDQGYHSKTALGSERCVDTRCEYLPREWRVVLIVPPSERVISGAQESELLAALGKEANPFRARMFALAEKLLPSRQEEPFDFERFVGILDEYMDLAARIFSAPQGGPYNGPQVAQAVASAQQAGLRAVGQSSWGPSVFGFARNPQQAQAVCDQLQRQHAEWSIRVVTPAWHGAQWRAAP